MNGDESRTRRGILCGLGSLATVVGLAGCGGSGDSVTAVPPDTDEAPVSTSKDSAEPTATPTEPAATESPEPGTPAETTTPTATPMEARVPPRGSLSQVRTGVTVGNDEGYTEARPLVLLDNVGAVTYDLLELRFDLYYTPIGRPDDRRQVASGYGLGEFDDERGFAPGERRSVVGEIRFLRDGRADRSIDDTRFDVEFAYRRVQYR